MSVDAASFRTVLGHFPTGVTIVTATHGGEPVGLTIGSFTSVSLDPPLVGFLPMRSSSTWRRMSEAGSFCVNVLGTHHADLCWKFASSDGEHSRFDGVLWHPAPSGAPILDRAVAWIDCAIEDVYEMGDHFFVLGRVGDLDADPDHDGKGPRPLIFFNGTLGEFTQG